MALEEEGSKPDKTVSLLFVSSQIYQAQIIWALAVVAKAG